jgi:tetratricopeptide (TPR) repeat protein
MRLTLSLALAFFAFACSINDSKRTPQDAHVDTPASTSSLERTISLYDRARDAHERGAWDEARELMREAVRTLDPETDENTNPGRILLLRHLSLFSHSTLRMPTLGIDVWGRMQRAQARLSRLIPLGDPRRAPDVAWETRGPGTEELKRPTNLDMFRPEAAVPREGNEADSLDGEGSVVEADGTGEADKTARTGRMGQGADGIEVRTGAPVGPDILSTEGHGSEAKDAESPDKSAGNRAAEPFEMRVLLAQALLRMGRFEEALLLLDRELRGLEAARGEHPGDAERLRSLRSLALERRGGTNVASEAIGAPLPQAVNRSVNAAANVVSEAPSGLDPGDLDSLRMLLKTLSGGLHNVTANGPASLFDVGRIACVVGAYDEASRCYELLLAGSADDSITRLRAAMGKARVAEARGQSGESTAAHAQLAAEARRLFPADHPLVLEARHRHAQAVGEAGGRAAYCDVLESHLADQLSTLSGGHPVIRFTEQALAAGYADQEDFARAIELQGAAIRSLGQGVAPDQRTVAEASLRLAGMLERVGEHRSACDLFRESEAAFEPVASPLDELRAEALRLQQECRWADVLELRRRLVEHAAGERNPSELAEDLRSLAAVLRVLGRASEALPLEAKARLLALPDRDQRKQHQESMAAARAEVERPRTPPRVKLWASDPDSAGVCRVTAEIEDPAGILSVSVSQDGVPREPSYAPDEWMIDSTGTQGRLEIEVAVAGYSDVTVISVSAANLERTSGEYQSIVISRP